MKEENDIMVEENIKINDYMKEVVIARILAEASSELRLFIGSSNALSKEDIINHIKSDDNIGNSIVKSHISFMKAVSSGRFIKEMNKIE